MITLKDYAKKRNTSYEAVRQQVNRYRDELGDHLYKQGRTQFLDDEAVAFLDARRKTNPVVVIEHDKDDRIAELKAQNEALKVKIMQLQEVIISRDDRIMELTDRVLLLSQPEPAPEEEKKESEADPEPERPEDQTDDSTISNKKWWHFWR